MVCVRFSAGGAAGVKRAVEVCGTHGTTATRFVHPPEARGALTSSRLASRSAPQMGVPHRAQSPRVWPIRWMPDCALAADARPDAQSAPSKIHENTKNSRAIARLSVACLEGLEPPVSWFVAKHSIRLSYRHTLFQQHEILYQRRLKMSMQNCGNSKVNNISRPHETRKKRAYYPQI